MSNKEISPSWEEVFSGKDLPFVHKAASTFINHEAHSKDIPPYEPKIDMETFPAEAEKAKQRMLLLAPKCGICSEVAITKPKLSYSLSYFIKTEWMCKFCFDKVLKLEKALKLASAMQDFSEASSACSSKD